MKRIVVAFVILVILCAIGVFTGCASSENKNSDTGFKERYGCIHYLVNGSSSYERVKVVDLTEEGEYLVIHVDSSNKAPVNTAKNTVKFLGCPGMPDIDGRTDIFDVSIRGISK